VRNLAPLVLEPTPRFNVIYGDNGQGKTNLLETLYVVGALRSFRTHRLAEMICLGQEQAYIAARIERQGLERVYELTQSERGRTVRLDGKAVRPISKYFGDFNVVLFAPEDLQVPRGGPAQRRRFLDRAVFNREPGYLGHVQAYEKIVRNRNALLRDLGSGSRQARELLPIFDQQLADVGAQLVSARLRFLDHIRPGLQAAFQAITQTGIHVDVGYHCSDEVARAGKVTAGPTTALTAALTEALAEALTEAIGRSHARDIARGSSSVGPHRDDLDFRFADQPASSFASQGQLRALVLAWKTAEMELLATSHGEAPVLLLDDVSSELDEARNRYLFEFLRRQQSQCFITTTHPKHVLLEADRVDYCVEAGSVRRIP
jgi:DNA replication and repair protein RecF